MICRYCNSENDYLNEKCIHCGAPLPKRPDLPDKDYEYLKNYAASLNKSLDAARSRSDIKTGAILFFGVLILTGSFYFLYSVVAYKVLLIPLFVIILFVFFLFWGGFLSYFETKDMDKKFHKSLLKDIQEYLDEMDYKSTDLKNVIAREQKRDAHIFRYIDFL